MVYKESGLREGYTDSSFHSNADDSKSNSGYMFTLNGGAVCWKSSKQDIIVDSTIEAEYITMAKTTKEGVWMKKFIIDLGVVLSSDKLIHLYRDNYGAIA